MTHLDRLLSLLALPVGFFIAVTGYGLIQLAALPGGPWIAAILVIGFGGIFLLDRILDKPFDWIFKGGVFGPVDPEALRKLERSNRRIQRQSWRYGCLGAALGFVASALFSPSAIMEAAAPLLDLL